MMSLSEILTLGHAASRLAPKMALHMARRSLRNRLAPCFASPYIKRLQRRKLMLPTLDMPHSLTPELLNTAAFYSAEYNNSIDHIADGRFTLHGRTVDFGTAAIPDWNYSFADEGDHQMWRVKLAHMGYLAPMILYAGTKYRQTIINLIGSASQKSEVTAIGAFSGFWFPYAASHRILAIGASLLIARHNNTIPPAVDREIVDFLRTNVAFVLDNIEYELFNNHMERNLAALCLYFSYVDVVPLEIATTLQRDVTQLIDKTILKDGCQIERSPMYQGLSFISLEIMAAASFLSDELRARLRDHVAKSKRAFAILCGPDGEIALFNDAWHGEVPRWNGPPAPDGRSLLPQGGYGRLSQGQDLCLMDAGALGPRWNPGHGHADFLSIELTLSGRRLAVDPGTSRYNTGPDRARERAAHSHNGPVWQGHEPVNFLGCFKVGKLADAHLIDEDRLPEDTVAGVFTSRCGTMGRMVRHYSSNGFLIADLWDAPHTEGQVTWLIPAEWNPVRTGKNALQLRHYDGHTAQLVPLIFADTGPLTPSHWAHHYGHLDNAYNFRAHPKRHLNTQRLLTWIGHDAPPRGAVTDGETLFDHLQEFVRKRPS